MIIVCEEMYSWHHPAALISSPARRTRKPLLYHMSIAFFSTILFQNIRSDRSVAIRAAVARRNACRYLRKLSVSDVLLHASTEFELQTLKKPPNNLTNSMKIVLWLSKMLMNTHISLLVTKMNNSEKQSHPQVFFSK